MKRIVCLILAVLLCVAIVGCKKRDPLDLDTSSMDDISAYSQIRMLGEYPDLFYGHKIKIRGMLVTDESGDKYYCAINGGSEDKYVYMELALAEGESFPELGSEIVIEGTLDETFTSNLNTVFCGRIIESEILDVHEAYDSHEGHNH